MLLLHLDLAENPGLVAVLAVVDSIDSTPRNFGTHHMRRTDPVHHSTERTARCSPLPHYLDCSRLADLMYLVAQQALWETEHLHSPHHNLRTVVRSRRRD